VNRWPRVELLHHEGCPLTPAARRVVEECLRELGLDVPIIDRVARYPSPSVLIDGVDVMGPPGDGAPADACRLDVPTPDRVAAALRAVSPSA
jgi:hypothetical protein